MFKIFQRKKKIEDLSGRRLPQAEITQLRRNQKLLIIDDKRFAVEELLKKNGYVVNRLRDLDNIAIAQGYTIVLCDIDGVGLKLGGANGGHLISELKKNYPLKTIVAYSGSTFNPSLNRFFNLADVVIEKDTSFERWLEILDDLASKNMDPVHQWHRAREKLVEAKVQTEIITELEDLFVRAVLENRSAEYWEQASLIKQLAPDIRAIVQGLAANLIFKAITGHR